MPSAALPDLQSRRRPQLDALRAFAVGAVLLSHFSPTARSALGEIGVAGVRLFFVLSGFLITGILLHSRVSLHTGSAGLRSSTLRFYIRRSIRIFPPFFAILFMAALLDVEMTRETFWWHMAYVSNFLITLREDWIGILSHFWSLAVEEQFYLLWPWIILCISGRLLPWAIGAACVTGPLSRALLWWQWPENPVAAIVLTPVCMDFLGLGAALALVWNGCTRQDHDSWRHFRRIGLLILPAAVGLPSLLAEDGFMAVVVLPFIQAFAFAALIDGAARGFGGMTGKVLELPALLWLGKISYGIYLVHNFAHWLGPRLLRQLTGCKYAYFPNEALHVLYLSILSVAGAAVSWYLLERPLNRWKDRRFPAI